jgi:site-specific recombinase XerD
MQLHCSHSQQGPAGDHRLWKENHYREFLRLFIEYCNANSLLFIQQITPGFLRRHLLAFGEKHNPGGVHGAYRTLRAFFQWLVKEEVMAPDWKNPMLRVKAPKVVLDPLEPISIQDVRVELHPIGHLKPSILP